MDFKNYTQVEAEGHSMCSECKALLNSSDGLVSIQSGTGIDKVKPVLWRHSERDVFHAWIKINERHVFICGTTDFDEKSLKRIIPLKKPENFTWKISIKGQIFNIVECDEAYELLYEDGSIVKNEQVEAMVFNHMLTLDKHEIPEI